MTNDCVSITKALMMEVKLITENYKKNTGIKGKVQCKDSVRKRIHIFSSTTMIPKHFT